jgi:endoglucanase
VLFSAVAQLYATPPRLHVDGNKIKDPNGNVVVLRGVSMIDLGSTEIWWGGAINTIDRLTDKNDTQGNSPGWYTKIIRIPICPNDSPLCSNSPLTFNPRDPNEPNNLLIRALLRIVVNYCALKDVYVIIDYHHMANTYDEVAETNTFWEYMAPEFANDSHVLFELFNEPMNMEGLSDEGLMWNSVRNDMQAWVNTVRKYAPDNLILVGTPQYCQILAPIVGNPILDDNIVYVSHIYPPHWRGIYGPHDYYTNHITTCAAVYPVIMTEWGFTEDPNFGTTFFNGTISNYGRPLKAFLEQYGIGNTAWCASNSIWGSPMFWRDWTLRVGEGEMGGFAKDWLYEASGVTQNIDLNITKCKVTAGKTQGGDDFDASGTMASSPLGLSMVTQIDVNIVSLADGSSIYGTPGDENSIPFTVSSKNKFKYTHKQPGITSLTMDFNKKTFVISAKNIDLTGLACPLQLNIAIGNYTLSGDVDETIVNGQKTIPTRLMRTYKDTLIVTKAKVKNSTSALSDSLSVSGEIAVKDINDANMDEPNLVKQDVNIVWGNQTFTIPAGRFEAARKGHSYKCSKINVNPSASPDVNDGIVTATIDLDKCTFAVSIAKANINAVSGDVVFGLRFTDFNETDNLSF